MLPYQPGNTDVQFFGTDRATGPDFTVFSSLTTDRITGKKAEFMIVDDPQADGWSADAKPTKAPKKDYATVGCRFLRGNNLHKIYTYRVRKGAKVHLGQELVAETETGDTVVVVVEIHTKPQDNGPYAYKFLTKKVAPL